jgi:tetratricopeptide (TPR) repeat protein
MKGWERISAAELFSNGLRLLDEENILGALACFEKAHIQEKSPIIQSHLAYCIAMERGQISDALALCRAAIEAEPHRPEHYLNLARVYLKAKSKDEAIAALRKGLSFADNRDIRVLLERLGLRKKPVFSFLPRNSFLNKYLGLLLRQLRLR